MKRLFTLFLFLSAASLFNKAIAQTADVAPPQWTGIIVMVDDVLGITANNPTVNPLRQLRILNSSGTVVYQDGNTDPDYEQINLSAAPAGYYTVQIKLLTGWEAHSFQLQ